MTGDQRNDSNMSLYSSNHSGLRLLVADATTALSIVWTKLFDFSIRKFNPNQKRSFLGADHDVLEMRSQS